MYLIWSSCELMVKFIKLTISLMTFCTDSRVGFAMNDPFSITL